MGVPCSIPQVRHAAVASLLPGADHLVLVMPAGRCEGCAIAMGGGAERPSVRCYCLQDEDSREIDGVYGVSYRPTVLVLRRGRVIRRLVGDPLPDVLETILRTEASRVAQE